ncbi:exonuclease SbcD [Cryobacterium sp. MP_M5]|uniref:exonuclease SbcCD subunit D n=1 Tax=unclassified Cryobacterium TaxID=2649013 RepID=UPI0018CB08B3|nr:MULTISPECIES: exonuclease SbcCD subunit D [unclassified Cryobacterium]MBG6057964.1 exonuclease SbcD [Cryobacterium sp. MP_M3]MEC5176163.1 exonuclease SbcD [Cryobacterium sp. MP_M5]
MKILHTSDWHIGRTFHTHSTLGHLRGVFEALVEVVREREVQVVVVAGDVFDSAMPSADSYSLLAWVLRELREAGAVVVMTSGNHDSATRLGFQSEWAGLAGIHIITRPDQFLEPVTIADANGPVHFYGIPYLEPAMIRHLFPEETLRNHEQVLTFAMRRIREDLAGRGGRSVVLAHCFAAGVTPAAEATEVERDITAGGLDLVPLAVFGPSGDALSDGPPSHGPDYVALGHIHGRATLTDRVRYSGAPLHYSFSEAGKPRGAWLVDLQAGRNAEVEWVALPVPRRLSVLTGEIEELLTAEEHERFEADWVSAVLTDQVRPLDGMRRLQKRFPHCVTVEHRPLVVVDTDAASYGARLHQQNDHEIVAGFLEFVRNGVGQTDFERELVAELLAANNLGEITA